MTFSELLKNAKAAEPESRTVELTVGGELLELTVAEMPGFDWGQITSRHPPRVAAPVDVKYGYNVHGVCADAVKVNGVLRQGGEIVQPLVDPKEEVDEWAELMGLLSGRDLNEVADAIFYLNEWLPQERVVAAKKALKGSSKKSSS